MAKNAILELKRFFGIKTTWGQCLRSVKAKFGVPANAQNVSRVPGRRVYPANPGRDLVMHSFRQGADDVLSIECSFKNPASAQQYMSHIPSERPIACLQRTYDGRGRKGVSELVLAGKGDLPPNYTPRYKIDGHYPVMYRPVV